MSKRHILGDTFWFILLLIAKNFHLLLRKNFFLLLYLINNSLPFFFLSLDIGPSGMGWAPGVILIKNQINFSDASDVQTALRINLETCNSSQFYLRISLSLYYVNVLYDSLGGVFIMQHFLSLFHHQNFSSGNIN